MDIRQSPAWGYYISHINWQVRKIGNSQLFIRRIPILNRSFVKIQRPVNPVDFKKIDQLAKKEKFLFVLIEPSLENFNKEIFLQSGYKSAPKMTLTHTASINIDLSPSLEKIFSSFSENARRNIRKSQKNDLKIKVIDLKNEIDDTNFRTFYQLLDNLTKLKKFWAPDYNEFYKKMQGFKNCSCLIFAYKNKKTVAAVWLGIFKDKSWYMHTGITSEGYQLLANYLLVWEAIKLSKKNKLKTFDFEGIFDSRFPHERKTWEGFSEFKKRFHGKIILYPEPYIKIYSLGFKIFYLCTQKLYR